MKETVRAMLESEFGMPISMEDANIEAFSKMKPVSESVRHLTGFTPEKVVVNGDGYKYYVEFSGNIERLMKDQQLTFNEAMSEIAMCNKIQLENVCVVVDESCINKLDLNALMNCDDITVCKK